MMRTGLNRQTSQWQARKAYAFLALFITCHGLSVAQQKKTASLYEVKYENHNQIDPDALIVSDLKGQVSDKESVPIPQASLGIYTESEHKLVTSTTSDENGDYKFDKIRLGQYRLVVSYNGFCAANARITITSTGPRSLKHRSVYVHMRLRGIDSCSYANHTRPRIENGR
jgi:carboxypeptidase family protein